MIKKERIIAKDESRQKMLSYCAALSAEEKAALISATVDYVLCGIEPNEIPQRPAVAFDVLQLYIDRMWG